MSMTGLALRISAVRALEAAGTIAGDRIFDSAILPLDRLISESPQPFVVISTETETTSPDGRDINNGSTEVDLLIEVAMSKVTALPTGDEFAVDIFESDANLELGLAVLRRQVMACLFGRGGGVWGDVFRSFATTIQSMTALRGTSGKDGVRFAGRQIVLSLKTMAEPPFGQIDPATPWKRFIDAVEGDATLASIAPVIRNAIEAVPLDWPTTYTAGAVLGGYTEEEAGAIGISGGDILTEVTVDPAGWAGDQQAIDDQLPETP